MDVDYNWIRESYIHSYIPYPHTSGRDMKIPVYINEDLQSYGFTISTPISILFEVDATLDDLNSPYSSQNVLQDLDYMFTSE